ncbi:Transposase [Hathewaya proteolytica DSM 3090]|uniref:Transposase n=1 Tax=Hathewaya proteolytica DSM 3090 TaxID=1121331 RepID=A0A1M6QY17_9CLOT|nr:IS1595 family transposase [Hathewaya proteolytica]SHK25023.1 Transposase [Hathewaya proteolytica DSM 3090]
METVASNKIINYILNSYNTNNKNFITKFFAIIHGDKSECSCPHCGSTKSVKNGKNKNTQRFLCKNCGKSYIRNTNTVLYHSKKSTELWNKFVLCLIERKSLHKSAKELNINVKTAFFWRHKLLNALKASMFTVPLEGTMEMSHTYMLRSYKGNHSHENFTLPRPSKQRGPRWTQGNVFYNEPDSEKISILGTIDNTNNFLIDTALKKTVTPDDLITLFNNALKPGSTLITDYNYKYKYLAKKFNLEHISLSRGTHKGEKYNVDYADKLLKNMLEFFEPYKGIATKYLTNYIALFKYVKLFVQQTQQLLKNSTTVHFAC